MCEVHGEDLLSEVSVFKKKPSFPQGFGGHHPSLVLFQFFLACHP